MTPEMAGTGGAQSFDPTRQALIWRCCGCGRREGESPTGRYTDGLCASCLRRLYPQFAERVLELARANGDQIRW